MENLRLRNRPGPAAKAIKLLQAKRIAAKCDLTTDAVYKWAKAGAGLIPARYQRQVLELAVEQGVELTAQDVIGMAA
jgi:N-formylglutamate amidohydrolase